MKKIPLKKINIKPKTHKTKSITFTTNSGKIIVESQDQGGVALVTLKKILFGNNSTDYWLSTFQKIQDTLDKIRASERIKLLQYVYAPDFAYWFNKTDDAKKQTENLSVEETSKLLTLLATEYDYINKGTISKTLKEFQTFKKQSIDQIAAFFREIHGNKNEQYGSL